MSSASSSSMTRRATRHARRIPDPELERAREVYRYRTPDDNELYPISVSKSWPRSEQYQLDWAGPMLPWIIGAGVNYVAKSLLFGLEKATFRFDKTRAYREIFPDLFRDSRPRFAKRMDGDTRDALFAYCRVGGANPLLIRRERDLAALRARIPFDTKRIEQRLGELYKVVSLKEEAAAGRLFAVDFSVIQSSIENERTSDSRERDKYVKGNGRNGDVRKRERDRPGSRHTRDSRWREKYLPAPIGVFLEAPGFHPGSSLVPLAIQIDQPQPNGELNPVYYPDDGWGWRIAKLYFEAADVSFNSACGHVLRTHLLMEPFCMATARQLSRDHKIRILMEPHTRFTLAANSGAYDSFVDRSKTYHDFYSGELDEQRQIAVQSFLGAKFFELEFEGDLKDRGVYRTPEDYPYREYGLLWRGAIREFVTEYINACYSDDSAVRTDLQLQSWFAELLHDDCGKLRDREPVRGNVLDAKHKLVDLLAQLLFIAGPGHASQHYTSTYYYRYAPVFPGAVYNPPPWRGELVHEARFLNTLPPIGTANRQFLYNSFLEYRYGVFGQYEGYHLARLPQAARAIARLRASLVEIKNTIERRESERAKDGLFPYDFLLPSRVPNSINL